MALKPERVVNETGNESLRAFARLGMILAEWAQRCFPDAFLFALGAVIIVAMAALLIGTPALDVVKFFGEGFWSLIPFTMLVALVIIGGYVVASSPPIHRLIRWLASKPVT